MSATLDIYNNQNDPTGVVEMVFFIECWYSYRSLFLFFYSTYTVQSGFPFCLHLLLHLQPARTDIGSSRRAQLVHLLPLVPHARPALHHRDDLLGYPVRELISSAALGRLLVDHVEDPVEGDAASLSDHQRDGQLQRTATAASASHVADFQQGCHRVDSHGKVEDRVEGEVCGWRCARQKGKLGAVDRRGRSSEVVHDDGHVLDFTR